jgi:hypothetical protein
MTTNLPATLSTLQTEISVLTDRLKPATDDHIADAIRSILASGLALPAAMDPDKAPAIYSFALANVSAAGLKRAVTKVIRGEYEKLNRAFAPSAPELAALARAEAKVIMDDLARAKLKFESMSPPPIEKKSPESIKRVQAMVASFTKSHDVSKESGEVSGS